mmetsp:Transcript_19302/g.40549  ORF Transcript_19302/g.40549 Transcript_19302/m.40549 type:complete len:474 (+) Transcript_19302:1169-2590(+)
MPQFFVEAVVLGEGLDLRHILLGRVVGGHAKLLQQLLGLVQVGHLGSERDLGVARVAQELGHLLPELQDPLDDDGVVDVAVRGSAEVSLVSLFPERPVLGVQHHREVRWDVEGEDPWPFLGGGVLVALGLGCLGGQGEGRGGQPVHVLLGRDRLHVSLGAIKHVVAELGGQLGELLLNGVELLLLLALEGDSGQLGVAEVFRDDALPGLGEGGPLGALLDGLEAPVQGLALRQAQGEGNLLGLDLLDGLAQGLRVADGLEVGHDGPRLAQAVDDLLEGHHEVLPGDLGGREAADGPLEGIELPVELRQQLLEVGDDPVGGVLHLVVERGAELGLREERLLDDAGGHGSETSSGLRGEGSHSVSCGGRSALACGGETEDLPLRSGSALSDPLRRGSRGRVLGGRKEPAQEWAVLSRRGFGGGSRLWAQAYSPNGQGAPHVHQGLRVKQCDRQQRGDDDGQDGPNHGRRTNDHQK